MKDNLDLRQQLCDAWRTVLIGSADRGFPARALLETMASVAHEEMSQRYGANTAASYLELLAASLRDSEKQSTAELVAGNEPVALDREFRLADIWPAQDHLLD